MKRESLIVLKIGLVSMFPLLNGCLQRNFDLEKVKEMIPEPSPELEKLNMLVGNWETSGRVKMLGLQEPLITKGTSEAIWECDGRFLTDRSHFELGELGPMSGMSIWTWDTKHRKYRMWWFDGFGETAKGFATFDEASQTWHIKTRGRNGWCSVISKGTIHRVDENTLAWTWKQWDGWHLFKIGDMSGTSTRVTIRSTLVD